jgi:cobalt-zinc-cadmium efflux system outer membrane protein
MISVQVHAQLNSDFARTPITFKDYIEKVRTKNIAYAAEKFNVKISEADLLSSQVFPDPSLSISYANSREDGSGKSYDLGAELSYTLELGGKREARIELAQAELKSANAALLEFYRNLRAEASSAYLEAIKAEALYQVKSNSYLTMKNLSEADSIRYSLGGIAETDYMQSKLEAGLSLNAALDALTEMKNSFRKLSVYCGDGDSSTLLSPNDQFQLFIKDYNLDELMKLALEKRPDILNAKLAIETAEKSLNLSQAERNLDLGLSLGYKNTKPLINGDPKGAEISAGISIPLKLSNFNEGAIKSAENKKLQAESLYKLAIINAESELKQAFENYSTLKTKSKIYEEGLLNQAKFVLDGKIYSYKRGETSLLEALSARRTYNDAYNDYYETLFNYANSVIELEKSAAIGE